MAIEYDINSYRDLAANAIEDLKNYANDGNGARLMVSYRGYTEDLERLDSTRTAAPVEGLVTVIWPYQKTFNAIGAAVKIQGNGKAISVKAFVEAFGDELVNRSQAEAIIAAKDERLKDCRSVINEFKREIKKHEADNAALTARIKELETERYKLAYAITGGEDDPGYLDSLSVETLVEVDRDNARRWFAETDRAQALEAQLAAAREGVKYALANLRMSKRNEEFLASALQWSEPTAPCYANALEDRP